MASSSTHPRCWASRVRLRLPASAALGASRGVCVAGVHGTPTCTSGQRSTAHQGRLHLAGAVAAAGCRATPARLPHPCCPRTRAVACRPLCGGGPQRALHPGLQRLCLHAGMCSFESRDACLPACRWAPRRACAASLQIPPCFSPACCPPLQLFNQLIQIFSYGLADCILLLPLLLPLLCSCSTSSTPARSWTPRWPGRG